jgi:hypothetical protein
MKRGDAMIASLLLLACVPAVPALATRAGGVEPRALTGTLHRLEIGAPSSTHVGCQLGETRAANWINSGYVHSPNDSYYTLLRIGDCPSCASGALLVTNAHVVLWFYDRCDFRIEIAIVRNIGTAACPMPDRSGATSWGPYGYTISAAFGPGGYEVVLVPPTGFCITQDAFLLIRFPSEGRCGNVPALFAADRPCNPCFTYHDHPSSGFVDMCADPSWAIYDTGNPSMFVDADCCAATPVLPHGWGTLKQLYR